MKYFIIMASLLILVSCKDETVYANKFDEFTDQADTTSKSGNTLYNELLDSLSKKLSNYDRASNVAENPDILNTGYFSMTTSIASSRLYSVKITSYKTNKIAFQNFANRITSLVDLPTDRNRLKNFQDVINTKTLNYNFIYLDNIVIELNVEPSNDINYHLKRLLAHKDYKEIEFSSYGAFWTRNNPR